MSARTIIFLVIFLLIAGGWFMLDRQSEQMFDQVAMQLDSATETMGTTSGGSGGHSGSSSEATEAEAARSESGAPGAGKPVAVVDQTGRVTAIENADEMSRAEAEARAEQLSAQASAQAESAQMSGARERAEAEARRRAAAQRELREQRARMEEERKKSLASLRARDGLSGGSSGSGSSSGGAVTGKAGTTTTSAPPAPAAPAPLPAPAQSPASAEPDLPPFPWPPPKTSAYHIIPHDVFVEAGVTAAPDLATVGSRIEAALDQAAYSERSYHSVPNGFALATRIERIRADGAPDYERRWVIEDNTGTFSLLGYLEKILYGDPGRFRVIVFVVTDQPFSATGEALTASEARELTTTGLLSLPRSFREIEFGPNFRVVALIYEFFKPEGGKPDQVLPGTLAGIEHLEGAKLAGALSAGR